VPNGRTRRLFIKYEAGHSHRSYGHRGNIGYEAEVYQRLLYSLQGFRPRCLGVSTDPTSGDAWLILEYVLQLGARDDLSFTGQRGNARFGGLRSLDRAVSRCA